jgi:hypothetical protein
MSPSLTAGQTINRNFTNIGYAILCKNIKQTSEDYTSSVFNKIHHFLLCSLYN